MKQRLNMIMPLMMLAAVLTGGCRQGEKGTDNEASDSRLRHEVQKNEVEVMTLERTVFTRQLIANGKLAAVARSSLAFKSSGMIC